MCDKRAPLLWADESLDVLDEVRYYRERVTVVKKRAKKVRNVRREESQGVSGG